MISHAYVCKIFWVANQKGVFYQVGLPGRKQRKVGLSNLCFPPWGSKGQPRSTPHRKPHPPRFLNHQAGNCVTPGMSLWSLSVWPFQISFRSPTNSLRAVTEVPARHRLTCGMERWTPLINLTPALGQCRRCRRVDRGPQISAQLCGLRPRPTVFRFSEGPASEAVG